MNFYFFNGLEIVIVLNDFGAQLVPNLASVSPLAGSRSL